MTGAAPLDTQLKFLAHFFKARHFSRQWFKMAAWRPVFSWMQSVTSLFSWVLLSLALIRFRFDLKFKLAHKQKSWITTRLKYIADIFYKLYHSYAKAETHSQYNVFRRTPEQILPVCPTPVHWQQRLYWELQRCLKASVLMRLNLLGDTCAHTNRPKVTFRETGQHHSHAD